MTALSIIGIVILFILLLVVSFKVILFIAAIALLIWALFFGIKVLIKGLPYIILAIVILYALFQL